MMLCDHDTKTIREIYVENKYVLIYCDGVLKSGKLVTGNVTTLHSYEIFDDVQGLVNRAEALGMQCTDLDMLIKVMEHGGVLPDDHMNYLLDNVWDADIGFQFRMEALGYTRP